MRFCVEAVLHRPRAAYVLVRQIDAGDFTLPESPLLGGVPIRRWISQPRALKSDGSPDLSVFAFTFASSSGAGSLCVGDVVELTQE